MLGGDPPVRVSQLVFALPGGGGAGIQLIPNFKPGQRAFLRVHAAFVFSLNFHEKLSISMEVQGTIIVAIPQSFVRKSGCQSHPPPKLCAGILATGRRAGSMSIQRVN